MGDIVRRKIFISITAVMGILLLMTALLCFYGIRAQLKTPDINALRTDVSLVVSKIEKTKNFETDADFSYAVILNDGTVAFNKGTDLHEKVNLHSIGTMDSNKNFFTMSILEDKEQYATIYVNIDEKYYGGNKLFIFLWIAFGAISLLVTLIFYFSAIITINNDIFTPIKQIHSSTRDILNGCLDSRVKYDYDGETGTLCHDFELMRTGLRDASYREQKLKDDEKLLMASISHDLKTPLATIRGYLESICLDVVTDKNDVKRYCKNALDKTVLLGNMTNDILEHSKAEMNRLSINKSEVYTTEYFGNLCETLKSDANSRGFTLTYNEIPNLLISIDKTRIAQVMENLVGNSFKYGKPNGHIEISLFEKDKLFFVSVKDDGQGIAAEDLPFVFDKFFRGDKSRTQNISGSGLGLSISKYIILQHNGKIECDSILGKGTTVEFYIPCI